MEGRIDRSNRPIITCSVNNHPITCLIDTGFNGFLWMDEPRARRFGLHQHEEVYHSELANGRSSDFRIGIGKIRWLEEEKDIPIHVFQGTRHSDVDALLGTRLLIGCVAILDFNWGLVSIRAPTAADEP